ncbi:uncharacterized protein LOC131317056 [Rhododendron vialii]|uniref:uncharacterized protein LOC131317056 n=1 Tax=Rhododendron vialii TaxID=182163 RepID=UPI00265FEB85|nr:uncharacterized protein LOC131317056 [Rhododendron vialii]
MDGSDLEELGLNPSPLYRDGRSDQLVWLPHYSNFQSRVLGFPGRKRVEIFATYEMVRASLAHREGLRFMKERGLQGSKLGEISSVVKVSFSSSPPRDILKSHQMLKFFCKSRHGISAAKASPTYCGLSPEKALSASKYVKFETPDKPDSVLAFFRNHGFTQTQISSAIRKYPPVIIRDPQKSLLPKHEFLKSKGLSITDIARLTHVIPNIEILREVGVPNANIGLLLMRRPRAFAVGSNRFRICVDEVKRMGFNPSQMEFMSAIRVLTGMSKSTWEKKVEVYKKWGWTQDEILVAFKKHPNCMIASQDKINRVMDFLVKKMGWESSLVARRPKIIQLILEKRIVPRSAVYKALLLQGLIKTNGISLSTWLNFSEKQFRKKVLSYKMEEAPELLKLYNETLDLAK